MRVPPFEEIDLDLGQILGGDDRAVCRAEWIAPNTPASYAPLHIHRCMTMRTNIVIDDTLVQEALALSGAKTKRELVDRALRELVERLRRRDIIDLYGSDGMDPDYDYKAARSGER